MSSTTAGHDAVHAPDAPRRRAGRGVRLASILIGAGLLLALAGIGYLVYAEIARSQLDELVYEVPELERAAWLTAPAPGPAAAEPVRDGATGGEAVDGLVQSARLYPARWTNPRYWAEPEWAGSAPYGAAGLPDGFVPVNPANVSSVPATNAPARTLEVPAIGLSTSVYELAVRIEDGRRVWESPVDIVGHIPGSAEPGEAGAGWYFGHLESPVRGEGNVFRRLPDVVDLIQNDPVDIIIGSDDGDFLYRVTRTGFVHRDDLVLEESSDSTVTLVASYPRLVYDHRLLVTASLLAYRPPG